MKHRRPPFPFPFTFPFLLLLLPLLPSLSLGSDATTSTTPVAAPSATTTATATAFLQVAPSRRDPDHIARSPDRTRAVVLLHGLRAFSVLDRHAREAHFHTWQKPGSDLVEALEERDADVFAFSYAQDVPLEVIPSLPALADGIARVRTLGYTEIVLLGHSAGGIVAREFVEDRPDAGVTKVIQVCSPNGGARLARASRVGREAHEPFLSSLSDEARAARLAARADKRIPEHVQFVSVIGDGGGLGDFVVADDRQWPTDLRAQGIPAVQIRAAHFTAMRSGRTAAAIARLVDEDLPRWSRPEVEAAEQEILRDRLVAPVALPPMR